MFDTPYDGVSLLLIAMCRRVRSLREIMYSIRLVPLLAAAAVLTVGCSIASGKRLSKPSDESEVPQSPLRPYREVLATCRFWKGGPLDQRAQVPATNPYIASCLQRAGWNSDGTPLLTPGNTSEVPR